MKIVSWPYTAETNFKAVLMHTAKVIAAEYITLASDCHLVRLTYTALV
jgi:hypothetical protein